MPKYRLYAHVIASKYLGEVEADSKEEAINKACSLDSCSVSVCHQCSKEVEDPEIEDITADEITD